MKKRNIIYIIISIICVTAIILAVYYQIFVANKKPAITNEIVEEVTKKDDTIDLEKLKEEFNDLFTNSFDDQGYDISQIKKIEGLEQEDLIYTAYTIDKEEEGKYNIDLKIPVFNIAGETATKINTTTQSLFADKANSILGGLETYTVYNIDYAAYLNENILSLIIKSTLKEGDNAERLIVQTYNFDVKTGELISLDDVLQLYGIELKDVNKKIEEIIKEANKQAEAISNATGKSVYKRDINNAMYVTDNVSHFFVGLDGQIYIIYPYGNSNFTSEIDIVKI